MNSPYNPQDGGGYPGGGGYSGPGYPGGGYAGGGYTPQQDFQQRGYLQGGPVDFQNAIKQQFANLMNFEGRASRSAYWWYALPVVIIVVILYSILPIAFGALLAIIIELTALSVGIRRMHDVDRSGWWLLLALTIIGGFVLLYWSIQPGTPGQNRFG